MQLLYHTAVDRFGIQPFKGQEHHGKIGSVRRVDVLITDILGKQQNPRTENFRGLVHPGLFSGIIGVQQLLIGVAGELGVDGQIDAAPILGGELDGVFHRVAAALFGDHIGFVLLRREDFLQNGAKLDFAQNTARLDVGEDFFQVAHAGSQRLHFTQPFINGFQPFAHQLEGLGHAVFQCFLQLFVHHLPHFVQLFGVLGLEVRELLLHRLPDGFQLLAAFFGKALHPGFGVGVHAGQLGRNFLSHTGKLFGGVPAGFFQLAALFLADGLLPVLQQRAHMLHRGLHRAAELGAQAALAVVHGAAQLSGSAAGSVGELSLHLRQLLMEIARGFAGIFAVQQQYDLQGQHC